MIKIRKRFNEFLVDEVASDSVDDLVDLSQTVNPVLVVNESNRIQTKALVLTGEIGTGGSNFFFGSGEDYSNILQFPLFVDVRLKASSISGDWNLELKYQFENVQGQQEIQLDSNFTSATSKLINVDNIALFPQSGNTRIKDDSLEVSLTNNSSLPVIVDYKFFIRNQNLDITTI